MNERQPESPDSSTTAREWPYATAFLWLVAAVAITAGFAGQLYSTSADLGHHGVLVSRLMETWSLPDTDANLQYMTSYPRGAHLLGSIAGWFTGSAIIGMQIVAILAIFGVWSAIGWGLAKLPSHQATLSAVLIGVALLLNALVGLEVFGHELISNYFFAHMVSQSLAIIGLIIALRTESARARTPIPYLILGVAAPLLASVHLLPAIELLGTLAILVVANSVSSPSRPATRELAIGFPILLASSALTIANPAFSAMYQVSGHEGATLLKFITGIPSLMTVATLTALSSLALLFLWWRERADPDCYAGLLPKYFGALGLSIAGLCTVQLVMHGVLGIGSKYACFKYAIGLQSLLIVNLALLAGRLLANFRMPRAQVPKMLVPAGLATTATLALFLGHTPISAAALVAAEKDARTYFRSNASQHSGAEDIAVNIDGAPQVAGYIVSRISLHNSDEWMLYEILHGRMPQDAERIGHVLTSPGAAPWDVEKCRKEVAGTLVVVDGACVLASMSSVPCTGTIPFSSSGALDRAMTGFSAAESNGRWSISDTARLRCKVEGKQPTVAYLSTIGLVTENHPQRMSVSVNGSAPVATDFSAQSPSHIVTIPSPRQVASELVFSFTFPDAISPEALGMSSDERQLAVKVHSLGFD